MFGSFIVLAVSGYVINKSVIKKPYITPDEFEVGRCCVYIRGESDSAFGTEIVTEMNKVRKDLGYDELIKNKSLSTCADRRTRETVALYAHARPNGEQFFSLAPEHFKAEITRTHSKQSNQIIERQTL